MLETFNAPRIDHCKAVPPAVRGTLTEASRETAYFGGPKAYVRSLPSKHFRDYKEGTLWRMHEMLGSKAQRHAEAVAAYNSERVEVRAPCRPRACCFPRWIELGWSVVAWVASVADG